MHVTEPLGPLLDKSFFDRSVHDVAPGLIGATMLFDGVGGLIVETEAYHHTDPASHSYRRRRRATARCSGLAAMPMSIGPTASIGA